MRKIKIEKWKAENAKGEEVEENLLMGINAIISNKKPTELPKGIEKFRIFGRIGKSFDKAHKTGVLELEEEDYKFLKEIIEKDIPSQWALNQNINKAIDDFLNAKEE